MPKLVPGVDYWWEPLMWYNPPKRVRELALQHPRPSTPVT